ncbi:8351_t:CDS:2 [Funneliformis mosseae]|uniref:8351_t:CDS:1 n=1 Tax=Funneliformis mosseae TaxID=27381 RepID=A0A9N9EW51_FUNMO|nr:8351_t:CDS:2 [Funneliformis mosseae]
MSSKLIDENDIQIIDGNQELTIDMTIEVEFTHLFLKIGVDRIKNIKSYNANSISKFTKSQIQIILDYFDRSGYTDMELKKPNSYSGCKNTEKVRPKVLLEKS